MLTHEFVTDSTISVEYADQIEALNKEFFPDNLVGGKYIFNAKHNNPKRLLLINDGLVVGHMLFVERSISIGDQPLNILYIGELMIRKEFQSKGLGKQLLNTFIQKLKTEKYDLALLICVPEKAGFYVKSGMTIFDNVTVFLKSDGEEIMADGIVVGLTFNQETNQLLSKPVQVFLGESV